MTAGGNEPTRVCPGCGNRRATSQFYQLQGGEAYCSSCLTRENCADCRTPVITTESAAAGQRVYCQDCRKDENGKRVTEQLWGLTKRGAAVVFALLAVVLVRAGDELVVLFLRTVDEGIALSKAISQVLVPFRPILAPATALYQDVIGLEIALLLLVGGLVLVYLDAVLFGPLRVFDVVTFPGTVVHEWAHKTMAEYCGAEVTDVTYFQFQRRKGQVRFKPETFTQKVGISTAPLLVNTVVAIGIAGLGTALGKRLGPLGLVVAYWLAFSVGTGALPSHTDIDNIWEPILSGWRQRPSWLLAVPLVIVLRCVRILKAAYFEAIYGALLVTVGIITANAMI